VYCDRRCIEVIQSLLFCHRDAAAGLVVAVVALVVVDGAVVVVGPWWLDSDGDVRTNSCCCCCCCWCWRRMWATLRAEHRAVRRFRSPSTRWPSLWWPSASTSPPKMKAFRWPKVNKSNVPSESWSSTVSTSP